jgi:hypothetical protein
MSLGAPDSPFQRIHIDLMGPLRTTEKGNKYVMVMTDAFSKYTLVEALENKEAETVARVLYEKWVCKFSVPRVVVSDQGKEFCSKILDELCVLLGIEQRRTSAYHPQSNLAAESYNHSFIKYMKAMLDGSTLDWENWLPAMSISYNCQVHKSTLYSPFYLTFLQDPNLPYFDMESPAPRYAESWPTEAFLRLQKAYQLAKHNNTAADAKAKEYYDLRSKEQSFSVGDRVMVFYPKQMTPGNAKLVTNWRDGFRVIQRTGPLSYVVKRSPHSLPTTVHVNRLKLEPLHPSDSRAAIVKEVPPPTPASLSDPFQLDMTEEEEEVPVRPVTPPPAALLPPVDADLRGLARQQALFPDADPVQPQHLGPMDRLALQVFEPRRTRAQGVVPDQPNVQGRPVEYKTYTKKK